MKYDVMFSCGHEETIQLFGKHTERERRIAWYENHGDCSACRRAAKMAEPIKANVTFSVKKNSYMVYLTGYTFGHKDNIKSKGFKWDGDHWCIFAATEEQCHEMIAELEQVLETVVETAVSEKIDEFKADAEVEAKRQEKRQAKIDAVKANKPQKPECIASGYWNGSFYKSNKGEGWKRIYLENKEKHLTPEEVAQIEAYKSDMQKYKEALERAERTW